MVWSFETAGWFGRHDEAKSMPIRLIAVPAGQGRGARECKSEKTWVGFFEDEVTLDKPAVKPGACILFCHPILIMGVGDCLQVSETIPILH